MKNSTNIIPLLLLSVLSGPLGARAQDYGLGQSDAGFQVPASTPDTASKSLAIPAVLLENDFNSFFNPSQLVNYGTLYGEVLQAGPWGGATIPLPNDAKLAIFLGRPYQTPSVSLNLAPFTASEAAGDLAVIDSSGFSAIGNGPFTSVDFSLPALYNHIDILFGKRLANGTAIGIKYAYAGNASSSGQDQKKTSGWTSSVKRSLADHHLTLGLLLPEVVATYLDASLDIGWIWLRNTWDAEDTAGGETGRAAWSAGGLPSFSLLLRPVLVKGDNTYIASLNLSYQNADSAIKLQDDADGDGAYDNAADGTFNLTLKNSAFVPTLLFAAHTKPFEHLAVIYSSGFIGRFISSTAVGVHEGSALASFLDYTEKGSSQRITIPIGVSGQFQPVRWAKLRLGVNKDFVVFNRSRSQDDAGNKTVDAPEGALAGELLTSMGVGFTPVEKLEIDLSIATAAFALNSLIGSASVRFHY